MKGYVYRFLDKNGTTIYVGKTKNMKQRYASHKNAGYLPDECYKKTVQIKTLEFPTYQDAGIMERVLISFYEPKYNTSMTKEGKTTLPITVPAEHEYSIITPNFNDSNDEICHTYKQLLKYTIKKIAEYYTQTDFIFVEHLTRAKHFELDEPDSIWLCKDDQTIWCRLVAMNPWACSRNNLLETMKYNKNIINNKIQNQSRALIYELHIPAALLNAIYLQAKTDPSMYIFHERIKYQNITYNNGAIYTLNQQEQNMLHNMLKAEHVATNDCTTSNEKLKYEMRRLQAFIKFFPYYKNAHLNSLTCPQLNVEALWSIDEVLTRSQMCFFGFENQWQPNEIPMTFHDQVEYIENKIKRNMN